jgi:hypothetical protein
VKHQVIATLLRAGRTDLANAAAYDVTARAPLLKWTVTIRSKRLKTGPAVLLETQLGPDRGTVTLMQGRNAAPLLYPGDFTSAVEIDSKRAGAAQRDVKKWLKGLGRDTIQVFVEKAGQQSGSFQFVTFRPVEQKEEQDTGGVERYEKELVGQDIWGKEAFVHFYRGSLRVEQYPPGGKTRGVKTGVAVYYDFDMRMNAASVKALLGFAKAVKQKPYQKLVEMLRDMSAQHGGHFEEHQQRGVDAPNRAAEKKLPKSGKNQKDVTIGIDGRAKTVTIEDLTDQNNLPRAFTQGPRAFQLAIKTYADWKNGSMGQIMEVWRSAGVKYHYYMGMD